MLVRYEFQTVELNGLDVEVVVEHYPGSEPTYSHGGEPGSTEVQIEGATVQDAVALIDAMKDDGLIGEAHREYETLGKDERVELVRSALRAWRDEIEGLVSTDY